MSVLGAVCSCSALRRTIPQIIAIRDLAEHAHTPGIAEPLQAKLDALLAEWDFAVDGISGALVF